MQGVHASEKKRASFSGSADEFEKKFDAQVQEDSTKKRYSDKEDVTRYDNLEFDAKARPDVKRFATSPSLTRTPLSKALARGESASGVGAKTPPSRSPVVKPSGMTAATAALSVLSRAASAKSIKTTSSVSPTPASKASSTVAAKARVSPFGNGLVAKAKASVVSPGKSATAKGAASSKVGAKKGKEVVQI